MLLNLRGKKYQGEQIILYIDIYVIIRLQVSFPWRRKGYSVVLFYSSTFFDTFLNLSIFEFFVVNYEIIHPRIVSICNRYILQYIVNHNRHSSFKNLYYLYHYLLYLLFLHIGMYVNHKLVKSKNKNVSHFILNK